MGCVYRGVAGIMPRPFALLAPTTPAHLTMSGFGDRGGAETRCLAGILAKPSTPAALIHSWPAGHAAEWLGADTGGPADILVALAVAPAVLTLTGVGNTVCGKGGVDTASIS